MRLAALTAISLRSEGFMIARENGMTNTQYCEECGCGKLDVEYLNQSVVDDPFCCEIFIENRYTSRLLVDYPEQLIPAQAPDPESRFAG